VTDLVRFRDGAVLSYDPQAHVLASRCPMAASWPSPAIWP
jgi:phage baseplate assembly protein gpV